MLSCSINILNWNGKKYLFQCLSSIIEAANIECKHYEIIVIDNASTDGSIEFIKSHFPNVKIIALNKNYGFGEGNNAGIKCASGDIIVLLNNDMTVDKNFLQPLVEPFENDSNIFAVGSHIFFQDESKRREETGKTFAYWDDGVIRYLHQEVTPLDYERKYIPVFWASGGATAYDKKKFLDLGGFRSIYSPAYVEDVDISYRAMKRGWEVLFTPHSVVYHKHRASSKKLFTSDEIDLLVKRNHLYFIWANISNRKMLFNHIITYLLRLLKWLFKKDGRIELRAFLKAVPNFLEVRKLIKDEKKFIQIDDEELIIKCRWKNKFLQNQKKLSLLFVCPYPPSFGFHATGNRMYYIVRELSKNHNVNVLTFIERPEENKHIEAIRPFCKEVIAIIRQRTNTESDYFHIKPNLVIKEFCLPLMKDTIKSEVLNGKYDFVQFEYLQMAYLARLVKKFGIPMTWVDHEVQHSALWKEFKVQKFFSLEKIELFFRWMVMLSFELSIVKLFKHTIAVSKEDEKELMDYLPGLSTSVIPLGVDLQYYSRENISEPEETSLIYTGYYLHSPNVDAVQYFIYDIFPIIQKEIPKVKFYIVGAAPTKEVISFGKNESIIITGWVPDLRPYLKKAAVYVAPIRLGTGFRGKLLEAFAMGKPVVASSTAVQGIPVENGKNILIADKPDLFAEKVISLLKNKDARQKIGNEARKLAIEDFSWNHIAEKNEQAIYKTLKLYLQK